MITALLIGTPVVLLSNYLFTSHTEIVLDTLLKILAITAFLCLSTAIGYILLGVLSHA